VNTYTFFAQIHQDRFSDLKLIIGEEIIVMEPYALDDDQVYLMYFSGEASTARRLDRAIQIAKRTLTSPLVFEEA